VLEQIPQADPARRLARFRPQVEAAMRRVLDSGHLLLGPETEAFEAEFARHHGVTHAVAVSSGADAVTLALQAAGARPGDEVILPALTAVPSAGAVHQAGCVPRFVEIDPATRNIDPAAVAAAITPRTTAILPVHLHGFPAALPEIVALARRHNLLVIEDCAQAHDAEIGGRKLGGFGHAAAFSFYPTKNLGAMGDAGAVLTNDPAIAARVRRLRSHGFDAAGQVAEAGGTRRMDEVQAAILRVLLPHLPEATAARRHLAAEYRAALAGLPVDLPPRDPGAVYHQFAIGVAGRDLVRSALARQGVLTGIHYTPGLHRQPAFAVSGVHLPLTDRLCGTLLSLPIQPEVAEGKIARIVEALARSLQP
jgi:dTDP-4-amino-4,6-dideoxygalactose transaminase